MDLDFPFLTIKSQPKRPGTFVSFIPAALLALAFSGLFWQLATFMKATEGVTRSHELLAESRHLERVTFLNPKERDRSDIEHSLMKLQSLAACPRTLQAVNDLGLKIRAWLDYPHLDNQNIRLREDARWEFDEFFVQQDLIRSNRQIKAADSVKWVFGAVLLSMLCSIAIFLRNYHHKLRFAEARDKNDIRSRQLAHLGSILCQVQDPMDTLKSVGEFCAGEVADWCVLHYFEQNDAKQVRRLAVMHADPAQRSVCEEIAKLPMSKNWKKILTAVATSNRPVIETDVNFKHLRQHGSDNGSASYFIKLGVKSYIIVPLVAHGRILGTMAFIRSKVNYSTDDLIYLAEIGRRTSIAMENACLLQAAQKAIKVREDVVTIVSHDLRNPLLSIQLCLELIRKALQSSSEPKLVEQISVRTDSIERCTEQAAALINDILDVTKIESNAFVIDRKPVSCAMIARKAIELVRPLAGQKGINIDFCESTSDQILADCGRLMQVFSNLLGNAIKFTPRGGLITVDVAQKNGDVVYSVRDTGSGIPKENLPHVFNRYWQAQTHKGFGLGLGLSIVRGIIMNHGGKIWVESEPGRGTTFYFTIPLAAKPSPDLSARQTNFNSNDARSK